MKESRKAVKSSTFVSLQEADTKTSLNLFPPDIKEKLWSLLWHFKVFSFDLKHHSDRLKELSWCLWRFYCFEANEHGLFQQNSMKCHKDWKKVCHTKETVCKSSCHPEDTSITDRALLVIFRDLWLISTAWKLWIITESQAKGIDSFQRRKLRNAIGKKWPHIIWNDALYNITKIEKWSKKKIQKRRLNLFRHIMRLPPDTLIRKSIREASTKNQCAQGRPPTMWMEIVEKDLAEHFKTRMEITNNPDKII